MILDGSGKGARFSPFRESAESLPSKMLFSNGERARLGGGGGVRGDRREPVLPEPYWRRLRVARPLKSPGGGSLQAYTLRRRRRMGEGWPGRRIEV